MKRILILILIILVFGTGLYLGYRIFGSRNTKTETTSEMLLTSLKSEGFLISQVAILNQKVEIDRSTGNVFKDFFWGQDITASANIKVSSGIDLTKLSQEDIKVSNLEIEVILPPVSIYSVELLGNIQLQNKQGILKKVFDNDDGYNTALEQLKSSARSAAAAEELKNDARENARQEIERFIRFIDNEKEINVLTKNS